MSDPAVLTFLPWMRRGLVRALAGGRRQRRRADRDARHCRGRGDGRRHRGRAPRSRSAGRAPSWDSCPDRSCARTRSPGTLDFETNYFPFVELASPDLPWMFTPAAPKAQIG